MKMRTLDFALVLSLAKAIAAQGEGEPDETAVRFARSYIVEYAAVSIMS